MATNANTMPNSLDAEQALLGCMLIDNEILADVLDGLTEDDFYQQSHKYIITAIKHVFAERKPVDIVTLTDKLDTEQVLEKAGGIAYITELASVVPSAANYRYYFNIVHRDSVNRNLIRAAGQIAEYCSSSGDELQSVQHAEKLIYDISMTNDTSTMSDLRDGTAVDEVIEKFQKLDSDKDAYKGVMTGFTQLDTITNGLQKSDLIVLAARPGMGKTSLAMNIVENAAIRYDKVCVVFSLEMPRVQIIQRLLCSLANVSMKAALSSKLEPSDWKKLAKASEELKKCRIYIDDSSRVTPAEILSKCRRIKAREGMLDLVMVDYIQLMSSGKENGSENRAQEVASITRELKIMAKELDVPFVALSQLRRYNVNEKEKEPQLSDLRESGAIEQDADIVMFINRPDVMASDKELNEGIKNNTIVKGMADLIIAKHRNGETGRVKLRFKGECTKFVNPDPEELNQMNEASARPRRTNVRAEEDEDTPF